MTKSPLSKIRGRVRAAEPAPVSRVDSAPLQKIDGRSLRKKSRTEQMAFRFTPERRAQIERLAVKHNCTFAEVVEMALDKLER